MNLPQTPRPLAHIALASGCCDLAGCVLAAWGWVVMSFVVAVPEALAAAASDVANIGSALSAANAAAAAGTTGLLAAGADEVSAALASLFSGHAVSYQQVAAQATALHDQFVQALTGAGGSYALTEAANVQQNLLNAINAPTQALLGRPLIGDGAVGTASSRRARWRSAVRQRGRRLQQRRHARNGRRQRRQRRIDRQRRYWRVGRCRRGRWRRRQRRLVVRQRRKRRHRRECDRRGRCRRQWGRWRRRRIVGQWRRAAAKAATV